MDTTSRYPSSTELAQFRRSLAESPAEVDSLSWCDSEQSYRDTLDAYALDTFAPRRTAAVPA